MPVVTLFQSDRDPSKTFSDKKDADGYDRQLELSESVSTWLKSSVPELSAKHATRLGTLVADNKAALIKAFKGKTEALLETTSADEAQAGSGAADDAG